MTTTVTAAATAVSAKPFKGNRPRWFTPVIVIGALLTVTLALTLLNPGGQGNTDDLDPANPGYSGSQALAHVLSQHGVSVTVVRSQTELLRQTIDASSTVVITQTTRLSGRTAATALAHSASAAGVVLLEADPEVAKGMGLPVDSHLTDLAEVTADCQGTGMGPDFQLSRAGRAYTPSANASSAITCFPDKSNGGGAMVVLAAAGHERPPVILLGDRGLISNGAILDSDNAAIALHLFGQTDRLIWYVPSLADISATDATSRSIAPIWFEPALALLASAFLLVCLWRGRRLGRLVNEPLPVVVRAVETTESRGRMYRKHRDRTRASAILALATRRRLTAYLGLSASSSTESVAAAAAAVSGRPYNEVLPLLGSPAAHDDSSLLERANALIQLEKEVRRS